jgi:hypothetical protein
VSERRKNPRVSGPFDGTWRGASAHGRCRITDLGLGGCFVQSLGTPVTGEETFVTIDCGDRQLELRAVVAYVEPGMGFALKFAALADADRKVLEALALAGPVSNTNAVSNANP